MTSASQGSLRSEPTVAHEGAATILLALLGVGVACVLAPFANGKASVAVALALFPLILIVLLGLPALQCLRLGPRILLILLVLRPLVDASSAVKEASSGLSLQDSFAAIFGLLLILAWVAMARPNRHLKGLPNILLVALGGLTVFSWVMGGLAAGMNGFARTVWGLLVALLLGSFFRSERQIDVLARAVFYSCGFFFLVLSVNVGSGFQTGQFWRLGGQYTFGNSLARVAFSFFLYGLYVVGRARTVSGRRIGLALLALLGGVIVLTQSRTIGGLMLISVCFYLWANRRRWILYGVVVPLLVLLFAFAANTGWRLVSSFSLTKGHISESVLTLTGRIYLWGDWLKTYLHAGLFHQIFGLGWGVVFETFRSMGFLNSSVTESSFLWFLVGAGALGLLAFSGYLVWVLLKAWSTCRNALSNFDRQLAVLAFLAALSFAIEGFTNDLAISPNANVYLYAAMSVFVFHWLRNRNRVSPRQTAIASSEES